MKKIFVLLTPFFLIVTQELAAQAWSQQTSNYDSTLTNVYFVNQDIGYVCGSKGTILKTVNGGTNWLAQNSGVTDGLAVIQFIDKNIGYASGGWVSGAKKNCTLVKTINGGDTWTNVNVSASKCGAGIWFVSADTGFYAYADSLYGNSVIAKSTNAGASWNVVYSGTGWISYFYFTDSKNGYATVNNGSVLKTTDGGQNWTSLNLGEELWGSGIFFFSKDTGFVGGRPSRTSGIWIFKTVNGGTSWQSLSAGNSFFKIFFADRNNGYALNVDSTFGGYMIKSTDGGANWLDEPTPKKSLWGIYFLNTNLGYAVGENGVILKYSIATSVKDPPQNIPARFSLEQNYPNPFNPSTNITFSLPSRSYVSLKVFELIGREVSTIIAGELPAGNYTRQWNAANMSSGVYFYRLQAGTFGETKKLMLLR
jgi:photosystem II stability/assembly factor-like uncharacterized protein